MPVGGGLRRVLATYRRVLDSHPMVVQSLQTSALLGFGDFMAQRLLEPDSQAYDYPRTLRFAGVGLILGPGLMYWYKYLDKMLGADKTMKTSLKKVVFDQLVFSPTCLVLFMGTFNVLEGRSLNYFKDNLRANYKDIIVNNWKIWPAVQVVNFSIVPLQYRVLTVQVVALGWNTYLAWKLHLKIPRSNHPAPPDKKF